MPRKARESSIAEATVVDVLAPAPPPAPALAELVLNDEPEPEPDLVVAPPVRPVPEAQLTDDQRRIRDLENQLALERGKKDPEVEFDQVVDGSASILIHFLEDGFTALGQVWYRGQELEMARDSSSYRDTCDRRGRSWLDLRADEFAQVERWGKVMFRQGPWPGKSYEDGAKERFEALAPLTGTGSVAPTADDLAAADKAEAKRRRSAPRLPMR